MERDGVPDADHTDHAAPLTAEPARSQRAQLSGTSKWIPWIVLPS